MSDALRVLGIIPARGGSRGIPGKNGIEVLGRPLVAFTIDAALEARTLSNVICSTDAGEIACIVEKCGVEVPFQRPGRLASHEVPTAPVVLHALDWMVAERGLVYDAVVLLQPTAPLRTADDIDSAVEILNESPAANAVVSLVRVEEPHPCKMKVLVGGQVRPFLDPTMENRALRRQDCPNVYALNGAVYAVRVPALRATGSLLPSPVLPYLMPPERSVNIDTWTDLLLFETLARRSGASNRIAGPHGALL